MNALRQIIDAKRKLDIGKRMLNRFTADACPDCQRHVYGYLRSIAHGGRQKAVVASHQAQIDIYKEWRNLLCPDCKALMDRLDVEAAVEFSRTD